MKQTKEPIRLRQRLLKSGNTTLYLDIYLGGRRTYEYLNLYLIPETSRADKEKNRETLRLADAVRAKRVVELQNNRFGFEQSFNDNIPFLDYFTKIRNRKNEDNPESFTFIGWGSTLTRLSEYCTKATTLGDVTPRWIEGFKEFLSQIRYRGKPLKASSKNIHLTRLNACLTQAVKENLIPRNPMEKVEKFKEREKERIYLTLDEVQALAETDCVEDVMKRAFLFACLTGLRFGDIKKMTWSEIRDEGEFARIVFRQKKTGGQEYMDINPQARELLGERGQDEATVFQGLVRYLLGLRLRAWAKSAGIDKEITFHTARHSFAVMMIDLGADLFTVQKLLGHRMIQTTQVYAKIRDKKKQEAIMRIPALNIKK